MSDPLKTLRGRIDALDRRLAALLSDRARLAQRIGALKNGGAAYRPEREAQVLRGVLRENRGPIPDAALARGSSSRSCPRAGRWRTRPG
jgi:chorismate mutase/prephenate dehydratase